MYWFGYISITLSITLRCHVMFNVLIMGIVDSVLIAYEPVYVWGRFGHAVSVVGADVFCRIRDPSEDTRLRVVFGAYVVSWALTYCVGVYFVDLLVPPSGAEQFARFFSRAS